MRTFAHGLHLYLLILAVSVVTGCASTSTTLRLQQLTSGSQDIANCRAFYTELEQQIDTAQVRDSQTQAIAQFPYLHVDRFLATYKPEPTQTVKFTAWLEQSRQRALRTQNIEWQNLPAENKTKLLQTTQSLFGYQANVLTQLQNCSTLLIRQELSDNAMRQSVYQNAVVTSDYQTWQRIAGFYVVTALPIAIGIHRWHEDSTQTLQQPYQSHSFKGKALRYLPQQPQPTIDSAEAAALIKQAGNNPLGIPQLTSVLTPKQRATLFARYAPVIEVDTISDNDRPGAPYLNTHAHAHVDTGKPVVYTLLSYTLFAGKVLPQFNYVIWFPARTCESGVDLLCGNMDGITWRVTVADNGEPLQYDTIHNCGCYHTFFPTSQLVKRPQPGSLEEWAFTPIEAPPLKTGQRMLVTLSSGDHHIVSLNPTDNNDHTQRQTITYTFEDYDTLRSLPLTSTVKTNKQLDDIKRKSLFGNDGIIAGTERGERYLFWPMGIPSPGAMRQWGHHATAFVGRRFFDDPCLLETYYTPALSTVKLHGGFRAPTLRDQYCSASHSDDP